MDEKRLLHAEERIAWLERHVAEQDRAMLELGDELIRLRKLLTEMRERMHGLGAQESEEAPLNERPPHY